MWWSKGSLLGAALAALSACGFEPALAPGGTLDTLRNAIQFETPENRDEFILRGLLEERLGSGSKYELTRRKIPTVRERSR